MNSNNGQFKQDMTQTDWKSLKHLFPPETPFGDPLLSCIKRGKQGYRFQGRRTVVVAMKGIKIAVRMNDILERHSFFYKIPELDSSEFALMHFDLIEQLKELDPPDFWHVHPQIIDTEEKCKKMWTPSNYRWNPPRDVISNHESKELEVLEQLLFVGRLRAWVNRIDWAYKPPTPGELNAKNELVGRIDLGLNRGVTDWYRLPILADYLDDSQYAKKAQEKMFGHLENPLNDSMAISSIQPQSDPVNASFSMNTSIA